MDLYLNSVGRGRSNQGGQQFVAHFNSQSDANAQEALGCSNSAPVEPSNTKAIPPPGGKTDDIDNMILEYTSEDLFGDCD